MEASLQPMIHVERAVKRYGQRTVLRGVSFDAAAGSIVALLGGNGAGKTTTLKCILGVIPFEGVVEVGGRSARTNGKVVRRQIGYVPQLPSLGESDTCVQALRFSADLKGVERRRIDEVLALVHLSAERHTKIGALSGGMRQRLALAAALLADPPVLLLDEPTASLDAGSRDEFQQLIARLRDQGKTIVLSTHYLEQIDQVADHFVVLHGGAVAFDGTREQIAARVRHRDYVVHLNGDAPSRFITTLAAAGIGPARVRRAPLDWDELLLAVSGERDVNLREES
jgi:ABC-type multidrug transport system ATPase subunit